MGVNELKFLAANSNFTHKDTKEAQPLAAQANNIHMHLAFAGFKKPKYTKQPDKRNYEPLAMKLY